MEKFRLKNGKEVEIRTLVIEDYEAVQTFMALLTTQTIFTNQYPGQPKGEREQSEKKYADPNACFLGTFSDGKVISVCSINIAKPDHPWIGGNAGFGITILEEYRGQGLGTHLMKLMEDWARARGVHRISSWVRHKNIHGIALYLKCGFEIEGLAREVALINGEWHHQYHIGKILK